MPGRVNFLPWRRNSCQNGGLSLCGPFAVGGFPRGLFGVPTKNDNFWGVPLWHLAALGWIGSAGRGVLEGGVAIGRLLGNRGPLGQEPGAVRARTLVLAIPGYCPARFPRLVRQRSGGWRVHPGSLVLLRWPRDPRPLSLGGD